MLWSIQPLMLNQKLIMQMQLKKLKKRKEEERKKRAHKRIRNFRLRNGYTIVVIWTYDVRDSGIRDKVVTANLRSWHFVLKWFCTFNFTHTAHREILTFHITIWMSVACIAIIFLVSEDRRGVLFCVCVRGLKTRNKRRCKQKNNIFNVMMMMPSDIPFGYNTFYKLWFLSALAVLND